MEAIPIVLFWSLLVWILFQRKHMLMYMFFASLPFGSFAVVPPVMTAGLTLTPTTIVALCLIGRQLGNARGLTKALNAAFKPAVLLLLLLFWIVAGVVTFFMPRFFAGEIEIIGLAQPQLMILRPTLQNLSQFVYISISVLMVFSLSDLLRSAAFRRHALNALCLGAALTVFTGLLDFASRYLPLEPMLDLFRTANYALVTNDEILDTKRVVGLAPEASAYGTLAISFLSSLYFFRRAMPVGLLRDRVIPVLLILLLAMVWLSTSSAAYLGLAVFGAAVAMEWCWRAVTAGRNPYLRRGLIGEFLLSFAVAWVLLLVVIATPRVFAPMMQMIDVMVLQKSSSSSYEERTMWTQVSWNALLATHGLGVGLGGTRASNFAVAIASNAGMLGAAFYFLFVIQCMLFRRVPRADAQGRALLFAVRWAYVPSFFAGLTIGTTPDFGVFNAFLYAFSIAVTYQAMQGENQAADAARTRSASIVGPFRRAPDRGRRVVG